MLTDDNGQRWATAAQIAAHLGHGVTPATVRSWAARDGLPTARMTDAQGRPQVRYPVQAAAAIEVAKRRAARGRQRVA